MRTIQAYDLTPDYVGLRCSPYVPRQVTWSEEGLRDADTQWLLDQKLEWQIIEVTPRPNGHVDLYLRRPPSEGQIDEIVISLDPNQPIFIEETPVEKLHDEVGQFLQRRAISQHPVKVRIWEWSDEDEAWLIVRSLKSEPWPEVWRHDADDQDHEDDHS